LLAAVGLVVWRPAAALFLLAAALPALDLAPWTGRFFVDEFDLLLLISVSVVGVRTPAVPGPRWSRRHVLFALLGLSLLLSAARGLLPLHWPEATAFYSLVGPYNALRVLKGFAQAAALAWLMHRLLAGAGGERQMRWLVQGMLTGLLLTLLMIVWERMAHAALLDFEADFRVSGPISAMSKGGAFIECYLAVASAFAAWAALHVADRPSRLLASLLLLGAAYGVGVTYSRNGYAAFALALVVVLVAGWRAADKPQRWLRLGLLALVAGIAFPILTGAFASDRLSRIRADFEVRRLHWVDALNMRDATWASSLFGMGLGSFPSTHMVRSAEPVRAGSYALASDADGTPYLRLGGGSTLFIGQLLPPGSASTEMLVKAEIRSSGGDVAVQLALCSKWLLSSAGCRAGRLLPSGKREVWQSVEVRLPAPPAGSGEMLPTEFALLTPPAGKRVDIRALELLDAAGGQLLGNGSFTKGLDRWFVTTDVDPPWHIHSMPVHVLFEQGWFGALAWLALVTLALSRGSVQAWRGHAPAVLSVAGLGAFLVSGSLNSLIDAPRFLALLLLLLWGASRSTRRWISAT
jgi:hypothetical protein